MTRKHDMLAALTRRRPQRVPLWELEFHAYDAVSGRHMILGHEFETLTTPAQERAMHANAEIIVAVARELHFAAITCPNFYWYQAPGQLAYWILPGETRFRQAAILKQHVGDEFALVGITGGVIAAQYTDEFCLQLVEDPAAIDQRAARSLASSLDSAQRFRDAGVDVACSPSDIADNSGPFFNPAQMDRWIYPNLTRWSTAMRTLGLLSILHTDGNITRYLERLAETGIDAIQALDPVAGMNMPEAFRLTADRVCLCGNVDCGSLLMGTPDAVFSATTALLRAADGHPFSLGASNAVQREVRLENYRAMIAAWEQFTTAAPPSAAPQTPPSSAK